MAPFVLAAASSSLALLDGLQAVQQPGASLIQAVVFAGQKVHHRLLFRIVLLEARLQPRSLG